MTSIKEIDQKIEANRENTRRLREVKREIKAFEGPPGTAFGDKKLRCEKCGKKSPVSKWVFYLEHFYVPPSGCTEGAYWSSSLSASDVQCPKCGAENRLGACGPFCWEISKRLFYNEECFKRVVELFDGKTHREAFGRDKPDPNDSDLF